MVKSLNRPKDNAAGIPAKKMHIPVIHVVFFRFVLSPLVRAATMISTIEKADVNVANKNNTKNTNKKKLPKGIWLNTAGRTTNNKPGPDRKSTRLNSSHVSISYAVFCLKKKTIK